MNEINVPCCIEMFSSITCNYSIYSDYKNSIKPSCFKWGSKAYGHGSSVTNKVTTPKATPPPSPAKRTPKATPPAETAKRTPKAAPSAETKTQNVAPVSTMKTRNHGDVDMSTDAFLIDQPPRWKAAKPKVVIRRKHDQGTENREPKVSDFYYVDPNNINNVRYFIWSC